MLRLSALFLIVGSMILVQAGTVSSLVGDKDCFGLPGVNGCPDGALWSDQLGGIYWKSYQTPEDPDFTDRWGQMFAPIYLHSYAQIGVPVSASLTVRVAGVGNNKGPWNMIFNGVVIGQIPRIDVEEGSQAEYEALQLVRTFTWAVPVELLSGSSDTARLGVNLPETGPPDAYSVDYSELTITTADNVVPEPGSWAAMLLGLSGLSFAIARRKRA
jgi:hypothetical protein